MRRFFFFSCPNDVLSRVGKIPARKVRGWIGFLPSDNIEYFKT